MATIEEAFDVVCKTFRISALNAPQKNGITKIVEERRDVFINLPTGFGEERSNFRSKRFIRQKETCIRKPEKQH